MVGAWGAYRGDFCAENRRRLPGDSISDAHRFAVRSDRFCVGVGQGGACRGGRRCGDHDRRGASGANARTDAHVGRQHDTTVRNDEVVSARRHGLISRRTTDRVWGRGGRSSKVRTVWRGSDGVGADAPQGRRGASDGGGDAERVGGRMLGVLGDAEGMGSWLEGVRSGSRG